MRIKNFTLLLLAVLFSTVGFAQKSFTVQKDIAYTRQTNAQTFVKQNSLKSEFAATPKGTPSPRTSAKAPAKAPALVTPPETGFVEYFTLEGTNSKDGAATRQVKVVWDDEDEDVVYISGLSYYMPNSFVKGTFNKMGDQVTFAAGQYMGNPGVDLYFGGYGDGKELTDVVANFNEKESSFTFTDYLLDNGDPRTIGFYACWQPGVIVSPIKGEPEIPVEIPSGLEIETYAFTAYDYFEDNAEVSGNVNVGIYGEDVYIQGMSTDYPNAWIKGTFQDETTVVFRSGQLLTDERSLYFVAIDDNFDVTDEYILIYDPATGSFTEGTYAGLINSYKDKIDRSVYQFYYGYEIKRITEKAATPAKSLVSAVRYMPDGDYLEFTLSKVDTDGDGLVAEKLFYALYYQDANGNVATATLSKDDYESLKEDIQEIPATLADGKDFSEGKLALNMEHSSWVKIGLQGIYYGGSERHESEITWYTPTWPQVVELPKGLAVTEHAFNGITNRGAAVERTVGIAFDGDDMYIRGMGQTNESTWVKGTKNADGDYVFPKGQDLGLYYGEDRLFFVGYANEVFTDPVLKVDAASGVYEFTTDVIENADYTDKSYYVLWINAGSTINMAEAGQEVYEPVTVPEGLKTEVYSFSATDYFDKVTVSRSLNVGFDGEDVYVQGLSETIPEAWVKGTLDGDVVTFASGQYLGQYSGNDLWFIGYNMDSGGVSNYTMIYDEETFTFTNSVENELFGINTYKAKVSSSLYEFYHTVTIKKVTEKVATPATPSITAMNFSVYGDIAEFSIPTIDVNGDGLVVDKLSYKIYYDEGDGQAKEVTFTTDLYPKLSEDMTVVPYGFLDSVDEEGNPRGYDFYASAVYLNMDHSSWTRVGIQSIYAGGGETSASEIGWYTITWPQEIQLPEGAEVTAYSFEGSYYNRNGNVEFTKAVNVAMVGDDVYVQGVGRASETAWIKGTKNPETGAYTFAKGQYMGLYEGSDGDSYLFLLGYSDMLGVMDAKMTYDEETGVFTTTTEFVENADYTDKLYFLTRIVAGAQIKPVDGNTPAVPATPSIDHIAYYNTGSVAEFTVPTQSVDGKPIVAEQLAYRLYYDEGDGVAKEVVFTTDLYECLEEDMTVIPYGFLDDLDEEGTPVGYDFYENAVYLNMSISNWARVGIQTIYTAGGEANASEIGWYTITHPQLVTLPEGAEVTRYGFLGSMYQNQKSTDFSSEVNVAKVGDDVYVQGVSFLEPETWIKGTKGEDNVYTFTKGQLMGVGQDSYGYFYTFLVGYINGIGVSDVTMTYDEETGIFTTTSYLVENADYVDKMYYVSLIAPGAQLIPGDNPDAISAVPAEAEENDAIYNISGQRVGKNYKGIIVKNGKKYLRK